VIMNFSFAGIIWALVPLLWALLVEIVWGHWLLWGTRYSLRDVMRDGLKWYLDTNPFVHAIAITFGAAYHTWRHVLDYDWITGSCDGVYESTLWILFCAGMYVLAGMVFLWLAKRKIRRNIF